MASKSSTVSGPPSYQRCWARQYCPKPFRNYNKPRTHMNIKCIHISSKCPHASEVRFRSHCCHNMQKPLYVCLRWQQKNQQHIKKTYRYLRIEAVNAKVRVQLTTAKLGWTHKLSQSEVFWQEFNTCSSISVFPWELSTWTVADGWGWNDTLFGESAPNNHSKVKFGAIHVVDLGCFGVENKVWLVVWNMNFIFPYIGNVIIPTDSYFSDGLKPPTSFYWVRGAGGFWWFWTTNSALIGTNKPERMAGYG